MRNSSTFIYQRPRLLLALLLGPPLLYMLLVYVLPLGVLLLNSFYRLDDFTGQVVPELSLSSYAQLLQAANIDIFLRTALMAALVTLASVALAFPLAYYIARHAGPRTKAALYLAVLLPLWSSYLIKVYSWKLILAKEGIVSWFFARLGLSGALDALLSLPIGGPSLSLSAIGVFLAFVYIWLPYMILPIQAALERVPRSLIEASGDLGARPAETFRTVTLPLAFPGVVAEIDLYVFAHPRRFHHPRHLGQLQLLHRPSRAHLPRHRRQHPPRRRLHHRPHPHHARLLARRKTGGGV